MIPRSPRSSEPTVAEASAWAEVLVRRRLLHAAVITPTGQWLVQDRPDACVQVLAGPVGFLALAASIQLRISSTRPATR
ncbi:hypothetical protein LRE75_34095 [Streptomyces sp. 372A]